MTHASSRSFTILALQKIRRSLAGTRRVLDAARTRVHASHGGAHGPENRREKVPKSASAGTAV